MTTTKRPAKRKATKPETDANGDTTPLFVRLEKAERERFEAAFARSRLRNFSDWVRQELWKASEPPK